MLSLEKWGAFTEYVARPLMEDIRLICEKLKELNLPISERLIERTVRFLVISHIVGECIRITSYIIITILVCLTVSRVLAL